MEHRLCNIGGGPRGTYVLLHMLAAWKTRCLQGRLRIHIIEPVELGAGAIYCTSQPGFLRLNTVASQVTAYPDDSVVSPLPRLKGPTLYEWYRTPHNGLAADAYPTRRDTGRYLANVFSSLLGCAPPGVTIECHRTTALDMQKTNEDEWSVQLGDGQRLRCHAAVLTLGCAASAQTDSAMVAREFGIPPDIADERLIAHPYPIERTLARLKPRETIGILGLGLTALDIMRSCTVGRGGTFIRQGRTLRYVPSGAEPRMVAWSRSGLPLMARAVNQKPIDYKVRARFLTQEAVAGLRRERERAVGSPKLDFARHLLPLLLREMADAHNAALASPRHGSAGTRTNGDRFRWKRLICPLTADACRTAEGFRSFFVDFVRHDVDEALRGNLSSPVKSACDVLRDLRDNLRYAVEFGGLTPDSHRLFDQAFTAVHNRLAVGPPLEAMEELLALVEAGVVDPFCGPAPRLHWSAGSGRLCIRPVAFRGPCRELSMVVNARLAPTNVASTDSPLVQSLLAGGHIVAYENALNGTSYRPGGIAVTDAYRVINKQGQAQANLYAIGALTEGCTWYSQVLARPYVNSRSMRDAASVAQSIGEYFTGRARVRADRPSANGHTRHGKKPSRQAERQTLAEVSALTLPQTKALIRISQRGASSVHH
ncbi:MAG TPA: FAD/NAD(P)-binding protein [Gemmataceae bacterium]|nr:FAD/NAD(P)-binding protein [Gemmataceae bacterium]